MLTTGPVQTVVHQHIRTVLAESGTEVAPLRGPETLHELGMSSLQLAGLIIRLEVDLGVHPYADDDGAYDARTVEAVVALYEQALTRRAPLGAVA